MSVLNVKAITTSPWEMQKEDVVDNFWKLNKINFYSSYMSVSVSALRLNHTFVLRII